MNRFTRTGMRYFPGCFTRSQMRNIWTPQIIPGKGFTGGRSWSNWSRDNGPPMRAIQGDVAAHQEDIARGYYTRSYWKSGKKWGDKFAYSQPLSNRSKFAGVHWMFCR